MAAAPSGPGPHEQRLAAAGTRHATGSYYTPVDVVERLLDLTLDPILERHIPGGTDAVAAVRVLDPSCGTGNFLVAAGRRITDALVACGMEPTTARNAAFTRCVVGVDVDANAAAICRAALGAAARGDDASDPGSTPVRERTEQPASSADPSNVIVADALTLVGSGRGDDDDSASSPRPALFEQLGVGADGFDLVIGNPPFLSQLTTDTATSDATRRERKARFGDAVRAYTDPAALFLLLATRLVRSDGVTCLIQPTSTLTSRDAAPLRAELLAHAHLTTIWVAGERIFDAAVDVCAPILESSGAAPDRADPVRIVVGRDFAALTDAPLLDPAEKTWAGLLAAAAGIPDLAVTGTGTVADVATATADFRDQYYGLVGRVVDTAERSDLPPLVTSGAIDPADLRWGRRATRFAKVAYRHPRVDLDALDATMRAWADARLVPKVLIATQTRVLEAIVDEAATLLPSVPVLTVTLRESTTNPTLWELAALVTSPPVTLVAARRHLGAALSADALKLSAGDVLDLPTPPYGPDWQQAGRCFHLASSTRDDAARRDLLLESGTAICRAFAMTESDVDAVLTWWSRRLPVRRADR